MNNKAVFFPGLNTIRFIAAFIVLVNHVEMFKKYLGLPNHAHDHAIFFLGRLGVVLFFVLSGYLITYLLLLESQKFNTIDVGKFYIRRILRIWPLYYLMLILGLFILPHFSSLQIPGWLTYSEITLPVLIMCIFFMPNLAIVAYHPIPYFAQAWSIGVEEQFYLIWPWLLKKTKNIARILILIILLMAVIRFAVLPILKFKFHLQKNEYFKIGKLFFDDFLIDTMAIGGLFAYAHFNKLKIISFFYHPATQFITYALIVYFMSTGTLLPFIIPSFQQTCLSLFFAVLYGVLILNVSTNPKANTKWFNNPVFDYLGKISYGIYMYHSFMIVVIIKIMMHYNALNNPLLYALSILCSLAVSALSYEYLEKYFLKLKSAFAKVKSTNVRE